MGLLLEPKVLLRGRCLALLGGASVLVGKGAPSLQRTQYWGVFYSFSRWLILDMVTLSLPLGSSQCQWFSYSCLWNWTPEISSHWHWECWLQPPSTANPFLWRFYFRLLHNTVVCFPSKNTENFSKYVHQRFAYIIHPYWANLLKPYDQCSTHVYTHAGPDPSSRPKCALNPG